MELVTPQPERSLQRTTGTSAGPTLAENAPSFSPMESGPASRARCSRSPPLAPAVNREALPSHKSRGGPQTPGGKAKSCKNALKHGLSARNFLPDIFELDRVQQCYEALREEWQPATATQEFLVRDTARHQAALDRVEEIELAVLRRGVLKPLNMPLDVGHDSELVDAALAAAGTSDGIERISRYRRQHERALLRNLTALRDAKMMVLPRPMGTKTPSPQLFCSEEGCEAYLIRRAKSEGFQCPECNGQRGKWLESRRVWQCYACRRQVGIRSGTVMEGSRVGMLAWFRAIGLLINKPDVPMAELAAAANVVRMGTIRSMARKIRQALNSPDASRRLAGLDTVLRVKGPAC
jgi:hypothetical protein